MKSPLSALIPITTSGTLNGRRLMGWLLNITLLSLPFGLRAQSTSISFPTFRSSFITGTTVVIAANAATAGSATITKVEFLISSAAASPASTTTVLGEDLTSPYTFSWSIPAGQLSYNELRTRVTLSTGATAVSGSTPIDVYEPDVSSNINYYVSPSGSTAPANNGTTPAAPWSTIQAALSLAKPGDVVNVMAGTYTVANGGVIANFRRTGTPTNWVTLKNYQSDRPVISALNHPNAIVVNSNVAYARIQGFEIIGPNSTSPLSTILPLAYSQAGSCITPTGTPPAIYNTNGISIDGRNGANLHCHHIEVLDNWVHDCGGAGISAIQSDYITIENNRSYNNSWFTVYGTSGISILNSWNFDSHSGSTPNFIIRRNRTYNNRLYIRWKNGATNTCKTYDGNGIILDNNNGTPGKNSLGAYTGKFLIENNVSYLNGGRGININYSDNVTILNNTTYQNGVTNTVNSPGTGEVTDDIMSEFIAQGSSGISVYNNIFSGRPGEKTIEVNASTITHNNNLVFQDIGGTGVPYFTGNQNITGQDPKFINAANGDFKLQPGSPAINVGSSATGQFATTDIDGVGRPIGIGVDIGAYEIALALPVTLSQFSAKPLGERVAVAWATASEANSAYFEVERSQSLTEFGGIGRVEAAGESKATRSYGLIDEKPLSGTSYYRLKQVDRDGTTAYSKIVAVVMDNLRPSLELLGNPTETGTIRVISRNLDGATYRLTTPGGQPVRVNTQIQANGELLIVPAQPLPVGVYLLQAQTDALRLTQKVLVR